MVLWLVHSVTIPICMGIWNDLKTRYSQGELSRISNLQMEVSLLNQGDLSIIEYFTKLRIIWNE